jgi:two-component system sensor histidine kinase ChvG
MNAAPNDNDDKLPSADLSPRPLSPLTYKILAINLITLAVLAMSFSYINQTRENLIQNELSNLDREARVYAYVLNEALHTQTNEASLDEIIAQLNVHDAQQISLLTPDQHKLISHGIIPERRTFQEIHDKNLNFFSRAIAYVINWLSVNFRLPPFPGAEQAIITDEGRVAMTIDNLNIAAWSAVDGGLILTASIELKPNQFEVKYLQLIRRDFKIEESFLETRMDVFRFSLISLILTVSFSLYLAGLIGHPLRKLAIGAEVFRLTKGRKVEIPDMSGRHDEIGELSESMLDMANALKKRLMAIEQFAADVAHELKNPITSMKSAAETLPKAKKEEDKEKLLSIIQHDLQRMDRLISDISQASRLDAELTRDVLVNLDIRQILSQLVASKSDPLSRREGERYGKILCEGFENPVLVIGHGGRLAQVFDNLISNALSFSPPDGQVKIILDNNPDRVKIMVEDSGPGIPDNRLDKIFDRFYSERPVSEGFGLHSGLGLSIAKQIVDSHGGTLSAENKKDEAGKVVGARFIVRLRPVVGEIVK